MIVDYEEFHFSLKLILCSEEFSSLWLLCNTDPIADPLLGCPPE